MHMKKFTQLLLLVIIILGTGLNASARIREGEAVEDNVKRIIADHLKIGISDIKEDSTLQKLGADDVDAILILTQAQYFFDISYDIKDSARLGKKEAKVSELIDKTVGKVYP